MSDAPKTSADHSPVEKKSIDDSLDFEHGSTAPDAHDHARSDPAMSKIWRKMDLYVLPVVTIMYFLSSLDRSNIGNARIAGLQQKLHMSDTQYSLALTVTLIPYTLIEIPSNYLLMIVGPRYLLPTMALLWGITCTLQGVVTNYSGLIACRFFLGLFEGGLLPGMTFYLATFYPRQMLQLRVSIMFSATSLASAFSGLLAAAIIGMDGVGNRPGWAWVFILEGLFTVVFAAVSFCLMPNTPSSAYFLSEDEKHLVSGAVLDEGLLTEGANKRRDLSDMLKTFVQPHVIFCAVAGFFSGATLSGLAYFLPSIVASLGYKGSEAQLMSVPPFAVAAFLSIVTAILADRYAHRGLTLIFFAVMSAIGFGIFYGSFVNHTRYGSLFLAVPGAYCVGPPLGTWMANNTAPLVRRGTALALLTTMTNLGSILSTWLLGALSPAPRYTSATVTLIVFQVATVLCAAVNMAWLTSENRRKERVQAGGEEPRPERPGAVANESAWFKYVL
ncbi:MFS general substrate transporter [Daedaleopsis nitida]|nr:MFS general substrate transporter [Daedaleopsis nitida]